MTGLTVAYRRYPHTGLNSGSCSYGTGAGFGIYTPPFDVWHDHSFRDLASALVLVTFSKRPMRALRLFAIASNAPFVGSLQLDSAAHADLVRHTATHEFRPACVGLNLNGDEARGGSPGCSPGYWERTGDVKFRH